jgi:hypothetical protein
MNYFVICSFLCFFVLADAKPQFFLPGMFCINFNFNECDWRKKLSPGISISGSSSGAQASSGGGGFGGFGGSQSQAQAQSFSVNIGELN